MTFQHEEHREIGGRRAWLLIIVFCALIVAWGLMNYLLIPDTPRRWDVGTLRDVPGESVYSVAAPGAQKTVPRQIEPLPEGTAVGGATAERRVSKP